MRGSPFLRASVRLVPACFVLGAAIEFFMLRVRIGSETFYDTAIRKEAERRAQLAESATPAPPTSTSPPPSTSA
eukprot:m.149318 g.149318  ORF g.149318 m.149318 type:complete len:74 (+) comp52759_c0_seq9:1599-1820(+)